MRFLPSVEMTKPATVHFSKASILKNIFCLTSTSQSKSYPRSIPYMAAIKFPQWSGLHEYQSGAHGGLLLMPTTASVSGRVSPLAPQVRTVNRIHFFGTHRDHSSEFLMRANFPLVRARKSSGESSISSPRRPALTKMVVKALAEASITVSSCLF